MFKIKSLLLLVPIVVFVSCQNNLDQVVVSEDQRFISLALSSSKELQDVLDRFRKEASNGRVISFLDSVDFSRANRRFDEKTQITYYDFAVYNVRNLVYSKFILRVNIDGDFYGTLIENEFDQLWLSQYDSFPGWDQFTGTLRMYNIDGTVMAENQMVNGQSTEEQNTNGKLGGYTCVSSTVDWYTCSSGCHYDYTEITTTCGWESYQEYYCGDLGCVGDESGTETLNLGDYNPPSFFQCAEETAEDLSGNCVPKPCPGNPLLNMEISQWNANKNSNRKGTCNRQNCRKSCPNEYCKRNHNGIDLKAEIGTNVYSVTGGKVFASDYSPELGNYIIIQDRKFYHLYAHLKFQPQISGLIEQGAVIGVSGESATREEPHLHYEVKEQAGNEVYNYMNYLNPEDFLSAEYNSDGVLTKKCN